MKAAVIFYHKNITDIYSKRWIDKCVTSIANQTFTDFDVVELDYGGEGRSLANIPNHSYEHINIPMENHIYAMNFLLDELFLNQGYDVVFNTNMDDYYHCSRFEKQLAAINSGYDLVSSDFCYIEDKLGVDEITLHMDICKHGDVNENIRKKHNVIAHPCVAFSKTFWTGGIKYNNLLGWEDLELWMRTIEKGKKLHIIDEELLYYRIHPKQVTKEHKLP